MELDLLFYIPSRGTPLYSYFSRIADGIFRNNKEEFERQGKGFFDVLREVQALFEKHGWNYSAFLNFKNLKDIEFEPKFKETVKLSYPAWKDPFIISVSKKLIELYNLKLNVEEFVEFRKDIVFCYLFDKEEYWVDMTPKALKVIERFEKQSKAS